MTKFLSQMQKLVWGAPALILILGVGLFLTVRLGMPQITLFPQAIADFWKRLRGSGGSREGISSYQALCTALAATVGTGNLVGVAGAICLGGPGAVFWMWICGFVGMATKFAEAALAVRYRVRKDGGFAGGPMYVITGALGKRYRFLAATYCLFGVVAAFGVGNAAQITAVVTAVNGVLSSRGFAGSWETNLVIGLVLGVFIGLMLFGGAGKIASAAERLVPFAAGAYLLMCAGLLTLRAEAVPEAFEKILLGALSPRAVTGGMLGSAFQAMRTGCSRGVFTNEAGMGTASIAHAGAEVSHPAQQGLMGIMEVFLDTIVICTLTALVILTSGVPIPYGKDAGAELTALAFSSVYGDAAAVLIAAELCLFAVATVLGWGLYGARCAQFLFGEGAWRWFSAAQVAVVVLSSVCDTGDVWLFCDTVNGLMMIPNLITLAVLAPELARLTKEYKHSGRNVPEEVCNHADFHQRKPL